LQLKDWIVADDVMAATEDWARAHASAIDTTTDDMLLRYTVLHSAFEEWMDAKLEKWAIDQGASGDELHAALKEVRGRHANGGASYRTKVSSESCIPASTWHPAALKNTLYNRGTPRFPATTQAVAHGAEDLAFLDHLSPVLAATDFDSFINMMRSIAE